MSVVVVVVVLVVVVLLYCCCCVCARALACVYVHLQSERLHHAHLAKLRRQGAQEVVTGQRELREVRELAQLRRQANTQLVVVELVQ